MASLQLRGGKAARISILFEATTFVEDSARSLTGAARLQFGRLRADHQRSEPILLLQQCRTERKAGDWADLETAFVLRPSHLERVSVERSFKLHLEVLGEAVPPLAGAAEGAESQAPPASGPRPVTITLNRYARDCVFLDWRRAIQFIAEAFAAYYAGFSADSSSAAERWDAGRIHPVAAPYDASPMGEDGAMCGHSSEDEAGGEGTPLGPLTCTVDAEGFVVVRRGERGEGGSSLPDQEAPQAGASAPLSVEVVREGGSSFVRVSATPLLGLTAMPLLPSASLPGAPSSSASSSYLPSPPEHGPTQAPAAARVLSALDARASPSPPVAEGGGGGDVLASAEASTPTRGSDGEGQHSPPPAAAPLAVPPVAPQALRRAVLHWLIVHPSLGEIALEYRNGTGRRLQAMAGEALLPTPAPPAGAADGSGVSSGDHPSPLSRFGWSGPQGTAAATTETDAAVGSGSAAPVPPPAFAVEPSWGPGPWVLRYWWDASLPQGPAPVPRDRSRASSSGSAGAPGAPAPFPGPSSPHWRSAAAQLSELQQGIAANGSRAQGSGPGGRKERAASATVVMPPKPAAGDSGGAQAAGEAGAGSGALDTAALGSSGGGSSSASGSSSPRRVGTQQQQQQGNRKLSGSSGGGPGPGGQQLHAHLASAPSRQAARGYPAASTSSDAASQLQRRSKWGVAAGPAAPGEQRPSYARPPLQLTRLRGGSNGAPVLGAGCAGEDWSHPLQPPPPPPPPSAPVGWFRPAPQPPMQQQQQRQQHGPPMPPWGQGPPGRGFGHLGGGIGGGLMYPPPPPPLPAPPQHQQPVTHRQVLVLPRQAQQEPPPPPPPAPAPSFPLPVAGGWLVPGWVQPFLPQYLLQPLWQQQQLQHVYFQQQQQRALYEQQQQQQPAGCFVPVVYGASAAMGAGPPASVPLSMPEQDLGPRAAAEAGATAGAPDYGAGKTAPGATQEAPPPAQAAGAPLPIAPTPQPEPAPLGEGVGSRSCGSDTALHPKAQPTPASQATTLVLSVAEGEDEERDAGTTGLQPPPGAPGPYSEAPDSPAPDPLFFSVAFPDAGAPYEAAAAARHRAAAAAARTATVTGAGPGAGGQGMAQSPIQHTTHTPRGAFGAGPYDVQTVTLRNAQQQSQVVLRPSEQQPSPPGTLPLPAPSGQQQEGGTEPRRQGYIRRVGYPAYRGTGNGKGGRGRQFRQAQQPQHQQYPAGLYQHQPDGTWGQQHWGSAAPGSRDSQPSWEDRDDHSVASSSLAQFPHRALSVASSGPASPGFNAVDVAMAQGAAFQMGFATAAVIQQQQMQMQQFQMQQFALQQQQHLQHQHQGQHPQHQFQQPAGSPGSGGYPSNGPYFGPGPAGGAPGPPGGMGGGGFLPASGSSETAATDGVAGPAADTQ